MFSPARGALGTHQVGLIRSSTGTATPYPTDAVALSSFFRCLLNGHSTMLLCRYTVIISRANRPLRNGRLALGMWSSVCHQVGIITSTGAEGHNPTTHDLTVHHRVSPRAPAPSSRRPTTYVTLSELKS